jgi:capsular polysaccharide transport system permease protein
VLKPTPPRSPAERPDLPVGDRFSGRPLGAVGGRPTERRTLRQWMADHPFLMWVVLPSLAAAFYLFFIAAPQYVSEARFTVRAQQPRAGSANISGELLGSAGFITSPENIASVRTFLLSHDSVRKSRETLDLVDIFRRPEADPLFRLWWANPTAERLRSWFRWQVTVDVDPTTGISDLRVWTFRPDDSKALSLRLMEIAEELVNDMNLRIREEAMRVARLSEVAEMDEILSELTPLITEERADA